MKSIKASTVAAMALLPLALCHMVMNTPESFGLHGTSPDILRSFPIGNNAKDNIVIPFPCQGLKEASGITSVTAGGTTRVGWTGSAVHGGGSCQFLVNYGETYTSDPADWKVVYTIIGGCPASAVGNVETQGADAEGRPDGPQCGNDSGKECVRQFDIPIPKGMKNGKATFAWTWFNKIGNREFYMNCAPITITGGTDGNSFTDSLPSMFVANLPGMNVPGADCTTVEGVFNIPNPGKFGKVLEQPDPAASGTCPSAAVPNFSGESAAPAGSGSAPASSAVAGPQSSAPAGPVSASVAGSPIVMQPTTFATATIATVAQPPASTSPVYTPVSGSVACMNDGGVVCIETGYFGICNHGFAVKQPLAAGTKCLDSKIMRRNASPRRA